MATFSFQGKEIYYKDVGEGNPLVILNGIMMSTLSWGIFEAEFSRSNRLILLDLLDQGLSAKMDQAFEISLQGEVVKALCDHLHLTKINLFGISYGGETALQFSIRYPEYLEKLLLFNTVAYTSKFLQETGNAWNRAIHDPEAYYATTIPIIYSSEFFESHYAWMQNRKKTLTKTAFANQTFLESMVRLTNSANHHDVREGLKNITVPTLIVGSSHDFLTPLFEQEYLHKHIENSHLLVLPNMGHASMYEDPTLFASIVLGFVNLKQTEYQI